MRLFGRKPAAEPRPESLFAASEALVEANSRSLHHASKTRALEFEVTGLLAELETLVEPGRPRVTRSEIRSLIEARRKRIAHILLVP